MAATLAGLINVPWKIRPLGPSCVGIIPFSYTAALLLEKTQLSPRGAIPQIKIDNPLKDYEFWSRIIRHGKAANIPEMLLDYREVPTSMSRTGVNPFLEKVILISAENMAFASGYFMNTKTCMNFTRRLHGLQTENIDVAGFNKLLLIVRKRLGASIFSEASGILLRIYLAYTDSVGRPNTVVRGARKLMSILRKL